jgi:hypothetical protein
MPKELARTFLAGALLAGLVQLPRQLPAAPPRQAPQSHLPSPMAFTAQGLAPEAWHQRARRLSASRASISSLRGLPKGSD